LKDEGNPDFDKINIILNYYYFKTYFLIKNEKIMNTSGKIISDHKNKVLLGK